MNLEKVVRALKERQAHMERKVLAASENFDPVKFAKEQGRYQGLSEAITVISEHLRDTDD